VDVDKRAAHYRSSGYTKFDATAPVYTEEQTRADLERFGADREVSLPVIEEQLKVGKREVDRGGVRVYSRVTERPVEEQVRLREEHVTVERRPVDRAVTSGDRLFTGKVIEAEEHAEEAVVAKDARVTEEIALRREAGDRVQTVSDTVRRTEVEVEDERGSAETSRTANLRKTDR